MSTHLPIRAFRPLSRQCLRQRPLLRPFSTTPFLQARKRHVDPALKEVAVRNHAIKSQKTIDEAQLSDQRNFPDDIGLLPGTFVRSPLLTRSSLRLSSPRSMINRIKERIWYEWKWIVSKTESAISIYRFKYGITSRPRMHFWLWSQRDLKYQAVEHFKHLYQSFANADRSSISKICLSGVATKFHRRIADRPSELKMQWKADISNARVISNRAVDLNLPGYEDTGVQQVVVRIASKQTLDLYDASEQARKNGAVHRPKTDKTVEYLVLQRQVINNKVKDWKIWGFMDESTKSSIEKDAHTKKMINDYQTASATA